MLVNFVYNIVQEKELREFIERHGYDELEVEIESGENFIGFDDRPVLVSNEEYLSTLLQDLSDEDYVTERRVMEDEPDMVVISVE